MKYTCVDASNGMECDMKATNDQAAVMEAFDDMTMAFSSRSGRDFDIDAREGNTHCYIDKWADDAGEDDDPVATASIVWDFEFETDYNTKGGYKLNEVRVDLFDDNLYGGPSDDEELNTDELNQMLTVIASVEGATNDGDNGEHPWLLEWSCDMAQFTSIMRTDQKP